MASLGISPDKVYIHHGDGSREGLDAREERRLTVPIVWRELTTRDTGRRAVGHLINPETGEVEKTLRATFVEPVHPRPAFWEFEDGSSSGARPRTGIVDVSVGCLARLHRDGRLENRDGMFGPGIPSLKPDGMEGAALPRPRPLPRWS